MTLQELAEELELSPEYLRKQWKTIAERYAKYDIDLIKIGRGKRAVYGIKYFQDAEARFEKKDAGM